MEMTQLEVSAVLKVDGAVDELCDLDLALVGGGVGDVILA
jgi:hypothetical protein